MRWLQQRWNGYVIKRAFNSPQVQKALMKDRYFQHVSTNNECRHQPKCFGYESSVSVVART